MEHGSYGLGGLPTEIQKDYRDAPAGQISPHLSFVECLRPLSKPGY